MRCRRAVGSARDEGGGAAGRRVEAPSRGGEGGGAVGRRVEAPSRGDEGVGAVGRRVEAPSRGDETPVTARSSVSSPEEEPPSAEPWRAIFVQVGVQTRALVLVLLVAPLGCERPADATVASPSRSTPAAASAPPREPTCGERLAAASGTTPAVFVDPKLRAEVFGRARGEPVVFERLPEGTAGTLAEKRRKARTRAELRALVLSEGYLASFRPDDALALATRLTLSDLFDEPRIFLQRGEREVALVRREVRGGHRYEREGGGRAELLLFDRIGVEPLARPLHVDLSAAAIREGLSVLSNVGIAPSFVTADLAGGGRALFWREGAKLTLACVDGPDGDRAARQARLARIERLREAVEAQIDEAHPFDRPRGEKTAEKDGQLRPLWNAAYARGATSFVGEGGVYPVFDAEGRPAPPEVCVEFIVDSLERASGTWYRADRRERTRGTLDFDGHGLKNRRGVLAFEAWASSSGLYESRRYTVAERVPFGLRSRFFEGLLDRRDVEPGDVVAIQGEKRDGLIHQHAILVLRTDPLSGFPFDLADQMKQPRRRTWEGIMAEAPRRSLLYRLRPGLAALP